MAANGGTAVILHGPDDVIGHDEANSVVFTIQLCLGMAIEGDDSQQNSGALQYLASGTVFGVHISDAKGEHQCQGKGQEDAVGHGQMLQRLEGTSLAIHYVTTHHHILGHQWMIAHQVDGLEYGSLGVVKAMKP